MSDELYAMSPDEVVQGHVFGSMTPDEKPLDGGGTPRDVLERLVSTALQQTPCGVLFSGGRDSSLVLAVATHVARREGLAEPIPITFRFPGAVQTDEGEWQEMVIRHLGLSDWVRSEHGEDLDLVGALAQRHLTSAGVLWPPTLAANLPAVEHVPGGSLLDGEGGDDVLGSERRRIAPVARVTRGWRRVNRWGLRHAVGAVVPRRTMARRRRAQLTTIYSPWLRPGPWAELMRRVELEERREPLHFAREVHHFACLRAIVLGQRNRRILAQRQRGVDLYSPLLHPSFVEAIGRHGGFLGPGTRADVLDLIGGDLLPREVSRRVSKADFTTAYFGERTREFARSWDGTGIDPEIVDVDAVRRLWLSDDPMFPTAALLQHVWLASRAATAHPP